MLIFIHLFSCSNFKNITFKNELKEKEIKSIEIAILTAQKDGYLFKKRTDYKIKYLTWKEYSKCDSYKQKDYCYVKYNEKWEHVFKKILKNKRKKFIYIFFRTACIDRLNIKTNAMRDGKSNYYIFFINDKNEIIYKNKNRDDWCKTNL